MTFSSLFNEISESPNNGESLPFEEETRERQRGAEKESVPSSFNSLFQEVTSGSARPQQPKEPEEGWAGTVGRYAGAAGKFAGEAGRAAAGLAARGAEALAGGLGGLQQLGNVAASKALGLVGQGLIHGGNTPANPNGRPLPSLPEEESIFTLLEKARAFPTPGEVRKTVTKGLTGQLLEPRSEKEKVAQEISEDVANMIGNPAKTAMKTMAKVAIPVAAQIGKQGLKSLGYSDTTQDLAKMGLQIGLSVGNLGDAKKHSVELMNNAREMVPQGTPIPHLPIREAIHRIEQKDWYKGARTASKSPAMDMINEVNKRIAPPTPVKIPNRKRRGLPMQETKKPKVEPMDVRGAIQLKQDINEKLRNLGSFDIKSSKDVRAATKYLNEVKDALNAGLEEYGKTNPNFLKAYKAANQAYAITEKSSSLANYIEKHYAGPTLSTATKLMIGGAIHHGVQHLPLTAVVAGAVGAGAGATLRSAKIFHRMIKSPALRTYYFNVLKEAGRGNAGAMSLNLRKLDKRMKEEEAREPLYQPQ